MPLVLLVAMFSLSEPPRPLEPALPPDAFDGDAAVTLARDLAAAHVEPAPGSEADAGLAAAVEERFKAIATATVAEQRFTAPGEDAELRNVILVVPGQSERQIALLAARDSVPGSAGAGSGIASTAALLEVAAAMAGSPHEKTLVFVSTDAGTLGAEGARRFARDYSDADRLDAALVLSRPASADPAPPLVIPWSSGPESTAIQLTETARSAVSDEVALPSGDEGPLRELFRLALPSGLGEQGPLIESGIDAVRLSSDGELPPDPSTDAVEAVDAQTLDRFGRSALSVMLALDRAPGAPEHGPGAYVGFAGSLLPGWTLSLLALALLLPVAAVAADGIARSASSPARAARALGWAALRALPFGLAAAAVYMLALVGVIPSPEFPFDPAREDLGLGGAIGACAAAGLFAVAAFLLRPLLGPPAGLAPSAPAASLGLGALAGAGVWLVNPYLGLLVAGGLQPLVPAAAGVGRGRLGAAGLVLLGCLPVLLAVLDLGARFEEGPAVAWDLLLLFTGEQLSDMLVPLFCLLGGAALAIVAANGPEPGPEDAQLDLGALVQRGRELEARRTTGDAAGPEESEEAEVEEDGDEEGEAQPPDPARDPRLWSKPDASTALPWASITVTPPPAVT